MSRGPEFEEVAAAAVRRGLRLPAVAAAEVYLKESRYHRLTRSPRDEVPGVSAETGMAVRLFRGDGRVGHAFAAGPDAPASLESALLSANRLADRCAPGAASFPPGGRDVPDLDLLDPAIEGREPVAGWMSRVERAVVEEGRGEITVESFVCIAGTSTVTLATSAGFLGSFRSSLITAVLSLRAQRGGTLVPDRSVIAARHLSGLDADRIGREAARRARLPLDGGTVPPGRVRVALEPRVACLLLEHLVPSLEDGAARRGRSAVGAAGAGARLGPSSLTIVDDASLPRGLASAPFDGEGRPTRAWTLVERGHLAAGLGAAANGSRRVGSSQRPSYMDPPTCLPANLHLAAGSRGPRTLLAEGGSVLRITGASVLGRGGASSGEVVLAASGERVEGGEVAGGIRGVTLVGRLRDLLDGILEVGNDRRFQLRGAALGSPTVLLDGFVAV
ncbi:MAG: TldD/PmbA family protein [Acidobacteriota bacterium]|jgi:PmbA protein